MESAHDLVNHPQHYKSGGMEAIDVIEAFGLGFHLGNAAKYILRADRKGASLQDLRKADWYLKREVARREAPAGSSPIDLRQFALCYLATPYTKYPKGIERAFEEASTLAAHLLIAGIKVYSPIAHTHPLAKYSHLDPLDHSIWLPFDQAMMDACDALIVAHMTGWEDSYGVTHEIETFRAARKPIFDLDPNTFAVLRREAV